MSSSGFPNLAAQFRQCFFPSKCAALLLHYRIIILLTATSFCLTIPTSISAEKDNSYFANEPTKNWPEFSAVPESSGSTAEGLRRVNPSADSAAEFGHSTEFSPNLDRIHSQADLSPPHYPHHHSHANDHHHQNHNSSHFHPHKHRRRHRRRLPFSAIGRFFARLAGRGKVAATSADDVVTAGSRFAKAGDKVDDLFITGGKMGKNVKKGANRGRGGMSRREEYRQIDPPPFNGYGLPGSEARKARSKALTGANLALATGGVAAGIWYFSGENTTLFIAILIAVVLISVILAALLGYCFLCKRKKRGYYAVNEEDILMAFLKKLLFYMFC